MIQEEDHGIDRVFINTVNGVRIASSNPVESLLEQDFKMLVNDIEYPVKAPLEEHMNEEEIETLNNIRKVVDQLHASLNIEETQLKLEQELLSQLEEVLQELQPLEEMRNHIDGVTNRYTNVLVWVGLGLMATQFGILARLTWWEYSWDIMEPITYFVTYGTAMIAYCYYLATKQEFDMTRAKDRQHLIIFHRKARKRGLDIKRYNSLKEKVFEIEGQLHEMNYSVNGNNKFN
uniref:Calcium uniporter protein n=1 Tax=Timema bartmani TaxID=61472 RepID=A0A7R9EUS9_9NEOP|nr:unnamed protein product [Timema bartmani]